MPISDPNKSFEGATRHFFRHIREADALRKNPIAAGFFQSKQSREADGTSLATIHTLVLRFAEQCRNEDSRSNRGPGPARQFAIIERLCLGETAESTASTQGLSLRQYYRERHAISVRIARQIVKIGTTDGTTSGPDESLDRLFRRARSLADQGLSDKAIALLQREAGELHSSAQRTAFLHLARLHVLYGDVAGATEMMHLADGNGGLQRGKAVEDWDFLRRIATFDVDYANGHFESAREALGKSVPDIPDSSPLLIIELRIELLLEHSQGQVNRGEYEEGRRTLEETLRVAERAGKVAPCVEALIAAQFAMCSEDNVAMPENSLVRFDRLLRLAEAVGSTRCIHYALCGLMRYHVLVGNDEEAYSCFSRAYDLAKQVAGHRQLISIATNGWPLLSTRFWRHVGPVVVEAQGFVRPGTHRAAEITAAHGQYLSKNGSHSEAINLLEAAVSAAIETGEREVTTGALRELATAQYRIGKKAQAKDTIKEAVTQAEAGVRTLTLNRTYQVATHILMDRQP